MDAFMSDIDPRFTAMFEAKWKSMRNECTDLVVKRLMDEKTLEEWLADEATWLAAFPDELRSSGSVLFNLMKRAIVAFEGIRRRYDDDPTGQAFLSMTADQFMQKVPEVMRLLAVKWFND
jgi:hypothetical protein